MSKKDTIIIASLINAAILALLMLLAADNTTTAVTPSPSPMPIAAIPPPVKKVAEPIVIKAKEPAKKSLDQGDQLLLALKEEKKVAPIVKETPKQEEEWYTVQSGDNPWKIAKVTKINYDDIIKLNQLTDSKAKNLKPGDRIRIR
ncbi:LysM peptidoglycan-binding domain-containing protein [Chlamydiales bacterium]|nr:LysM peptidoglycan-binding domain-containing protein [Chlamydiales bacterium]